MPPFLISLLSHWATKTGVAVLLAALVGLGCFTMYRGIVNGAYTRGYQKALLDHPQNNYYGPTTVIQGKKMSCFPLHIGHFGLGVCHD